MPTSVNKKANNMYVEPTAMRPAEGLIGKLSASQRNALERLLAEPASCIFNEKFEQRGIVRELFGEVSSPLNAAPVLEAHQKIRAAVTTLSAEQEVLLFERFNYARYRVCLLLQRFENKRLTAKATVELLTWGEYAQQARSRIIELNMPLVLSMAKRSRLSGLDYNELISEGNLALIRSAEKFDAARGFKFSTYACRAILKSFSRVAMKTSRYRGLFPVELNIELEKSDYFERKRMDVEEDCLEELKHILQANLADLNDVEQTVIRERFALGTLTESKYKTLEQVGGMIGVTKERVRQIQNKALQKIKVALEEQILAA